MTYVKHPLSLTATFLWIGFVCAISFMEAWLKFRAPGITVPLGLGIGRLVFDALNKVEWALAIAIAIGLYMGNVRRIKPALLTYLIPIALLIVQTIWLLPLLDERAELHIQGAHVPSSNLHFYYVGMEFIKIVCLTIFGISMFRNN